MGAGQKEKYADDERDKLLVNVVHEGNTIIDNLRILNLKPQICFRDNVCDPINLYHKVGHGKLDMYVLNPSKDSREVREFLSRWKDDSSHLGKLKSGVHVDGKELWLPISNLVSICALLVWYPANPHDTITRLLFPGSTPQHKIFKGLEKLKKLECLKKPVCSPSELHESTGKSDKRKRIPKVDNKNILSDNAYLEKKERLAKKRLEKMRREKEERDKQEKEKREEKEKRDKEKEELEKAEKEKREKERQEKLEKKKKADKERREKERQERKEREAAVAAAKKEKEEKEAAAKKEKEEKEAAAKKEKDEKDAAARKEREALRKEKEEKEANRKKEREAKVQKDL